MIPLTDLRVQRELIADEIDEVIRTVVDSGAFVGGPQIGEFERAFASWCGVRHAIGVANGTDALELALRAVGFEPGMEALVPASTFIATAEAVVNAGGVPVFVDVDAESFTMDPEAAAAAVTTRTGAILPVHLYGRCADMEAIASIAASRGVPVIEDASQAHGATRLSRRAGSIGTSGAFSFYPSKNLGAFGDGGMVTTDEDEVADRVRLLANHGGHAKNEHLIAGRNSRLDTLQAAVLGVKLRHLDDWNAGRREVAAQYEELFGETEGLTLPSTPDGDEHAWHLYVVRVAGGRRDELRTFLESRDIGTAVHYPAPVHLTPAFDTYGNGPGSCPVAEALSDEVLSLPMYPELPTADIERVTSAIREFMGGA